MDPLLFDHFLYVPTGIGTETGWLYELSPSQEYGPNTVVLVPYENPQVGNLAPLYFSIVKRQAYSPPVNKDPQPDLVLTANTQKDRYLQKVKALKEEIQRGNIYEINYCVEFYADQVQLDVFSVFQHLHQAAKAPYAALLKTGSDFILCASPELFLKKEGLLLSSKPIKGTARRGKDALEDQRLKDQLFTSLKERTENVMAVDVARNDLSMLAQRGTVKVNKLYNIETFETVHQMVSTVTCLLKPELDFHTILQSTFPMASMTGAPKLRAMTLTDSYEDFKRRYYSGTMGLVDDKGDFELWVLIRSIFYNAQTRRLSIAVGGAITYLSDPEKEYEECLLKAGSMLGVLNARIV